jgi:anti-sigma B factor antagonist
MQISHEDHDDGIRIIKLAGRMDIEGDQQVSQPLTTAAESGHAGVLVDLSGIEFLASVGIGTLVSVAKTVAKKGGRFAMYGAPDDVHRGLVRTNIPAIIPTFRTLAEARAAVLAAN